jgi:pimeloyl-ACP methyl ester carboxylesterase
MRIRSRGTELNVEVAGPADAPPVVLLHAFPLHGGMWSSQIPALARAHRVIVPDCRGFGRSGVGDGAYTIDLFVDDLFAVLDGAVQPAAAPVAACGLSMGGYVLLRALEREPERFGALVLADTKPAADDAAGRNKRLAAIRTLEERGAGEYAVAFAEGALGAATKQSRPEVVAEVQEMVRSNPVAGMVRAQRAMAARTDTSAVLATINVPTLVVVGAEDAIIPPEVARALAGGIRNARFLEIPGAGHLTPLEAPEAFTQALLTFL